MNVYLKHIVPYFSAETLKRYLDLVSINWGELRNFMGDFKDEQQKEIEYFLDTPMLTKPFIRYDDNLVVLSKHLLRASLSALVPFLLKKELSSSYKNKFGKVMEDYIGVLLGEAFHDITKENEIIDMYRRNKISAENKVVDFIIHEVSGNVYIDSKAIEPDKTVKYSNAALVIKQRLGKSFIKGVIQGQDCARAINKINGNVASPKDSLLIITHMDHYISKGSTIESVLDNQFFEVIKEKHGGLSIDKNRIYYMTIDEFEFMIEICKIRNITITSIIDFFSKDDSSSTTQKFNVMMHLHKLHPEGIPDRDVIKNTRDYLLDSFTNPMKESDDYWDGRISEYLEVRRYLLS